MVRRSASLRFYLGSISVVLAACAGSGCGGSRRSDDSRRTSPDERDAGLFPWLRGDGAIASPDGRTALTCENLALVASGESCPSTGCPSISCSCPDSFPISFLSCTSDGCLVDVDCEIACGFDSLLDVLECDEVHTVGASGTLDAGILCGNAAVDPGELCDEGGNTTACDADCTPAICGDGHANPSLGEQCDTGGESETCDADCTSATCGDGRRNTYAGESCDEGAETATCDSDCTPVRCGDGVLNASFGERCDDGNTRDTDGCSSTCEPEPDFSCTEAEPSVCTWDCGSPWSFDTEGQFSIAIPAGCRITIEAWGGGGGGGASTPSGDSGGGGGGGSSRVIVGGSTLALAAGGGGGGAARGASVGGGGGAGGYVRVTRTASTAETWDIYVAGGGTAGCLDTSGSGGGPGGGAGSTCSGTGSTYGGGGGRVRGCGSAGDSTYGGAGGGGGNSVYGGGGGGDPGAGCDGMSTYGSPGGCYTSGQGDGGGGGGGGGLTLDDIGSMTVGQTGLAGADGASGGSAPIGGAGGTTSAPDGVAPGGGGAGTETCGGGNGAPGRVRLTPS